MKKIYLLVVLLTSSLFASIGQISAIKGDAYIVRDGKSIGVEVDTKIEKHDLIKTDKNTKLQIIFKDNTIISLGQNSSFSIDDYLFTPQNPKAKFSVKGVFKSITGKIGHIAPKRFKLKTANATIGVRGTTILGESRDDRDEIICSSGEIVVSTPRGEMVVRRGEKTLVLNGAKPTPVVKVSSYTIKKKEKLASFTKVEKQEVVNKQIVQVKPITRELVEDKTKEVKEDWGEWDSNKKVLEKVKKIEAKPKPIQKTKPKKELPSKSKEKKTPPSNSKDKTKEQPKKSDKPSQAKDKVKDQPKQGQEDNKNQSPAQPQYPKKDKEDQQDGVESISDNPAETDLLPSLSDLRDRAGSDNLTYKGDVNAFIDQPTNRADGTIGLNVDLAKGGVNGDLKFDESHSKFDSHFENGKLDRNGILTYDLKGNGVQGRGDGRVSGASLEKARGSFRESIENEHLYGTFDAKRVSTKGK